jgi:hypothetical protein
MLVLRVHKYLDFTGSSLVKKPTPVLQGIYLEAKKEVPWWSHISLAAYFVSIRDFHHWVLLR